MDQEQKRQLYIVTLVHRHVEKRVYLTGESGEVGQRRFEAARRALTAVGDLHSAWTDFLPAAVAHFAQHGFVRIRK